MKPQPRPDWIPKEQIQAKLKEMTGVLVSKQRIGHWSNNGQLRMLKAPSGRGYRWFTKPEWLEDLVEKHTYEEPPAQAGGLRMPHVEKKPTFYFPRRHDDRKAIL